MTELSNARGDQRSRKIGATGWWALRPVVIFGVDPVVNGHVPPLRNRVHVKTAYTWPFRFPSPSA